MGTRCLGAILAGGDSTRMGRDKALVPVGGVPMVERVAAALRQAATDVVVVGREGELAGIRCVADRVDGGRGPLAGLATALAIAGDRPVLLVAVDQPLVRPATLRRLAARVGTGRALVPIADGARQVTCAAYPAAWAGDAAREVATGSVQSLLDRLPFDAVPEEEWRAWGEDGRSWLSVDSPADVARAETMLTGG